MSEISNKELVRELFSLIEKTADWSKLVDSLSDDIEWTIAGTSPISGIHKSKKVWMENAMKPLFELMNGPIKCKVQQILADGDFVVVLWKGDGKTLQGQRYSQDYCWILEIKDKKIIRLKGFYDTFLLTSIMLGK